MLNFLRPAAPRPQVTPSQIADQVARGEASLIDVRETAELRASGKAKGAVHIPLSLIPLKADPSTPDCEKSLSRDRPVFVYCASGARSAMAAQALTRLGYGQVTNLGGLNAWVAEGGQVERV